MYITNSRGRIGIDDLSNPKAAIPKVLSVQGHRISNATNKVCIATRFSGGIRNSVSIASRTGVNGFGSKLFTQHCNKVKFAVGVAAVA